jgi:hypothetical protein
MLKLAMELPECRRAVVLYFMVSFHDEAEGWGLATTRAKLRSDPVPEYAANRKTYKKVEHRPCLLCIDLIEIQKSGVLDSGLDSRLRNLMEHNTLRSLRVELQNKAYVPGNTFALTVIVCSKDNLLSFGCCSQGLNGILFCFQFNVLRVPVVIDANGVQGFVQGTYMSESCLDCVSIA